MKYDTIARFYVAGRVLLLEIILIAIPAKAQRLGYVTNQSSNSISVIDTETNRVTATIGVGGNPVGVAITPDGIVYVKEQMGHSSIQVTVDIYGHLIPGANVSFVDRLDEVPHHAEKTSPQQNATQAQPPEKSEMEIPSELADLIGGGGRTRTYDLRIMRPSL